MLIGGILILIIAAACLNALDNAVVGLFLFYIGAIVITTSILLDLRKQNNKKHLDFILPIFSYIFWIYRILLLFF